jgi:ribosomal protein S18 acetylase RimI-like enzyme
MSQKRRIEEASLNAWPALYSLFYDGWIVRFANGYTKRANSVTPLYTGELAVDSKIAFCEKQYRDKGLVPIFRLPACFDVADLDARLDGREYRQIDVTSVQGRALTNGNLTLSTRAEVLSGDDGLSAWLYHFHRLEPGRKDIETHEAILHRVIGDLCPMTLVVEGRIVACGLGTLHDGYLGLFDIVTAESERRKGYGRELTESLCAWGRLHGADYAYLQVMLSNQPALTLYAQLEFNEHYQYWYRVAP